MDVVSAKGRQFPGTEETRVSERDASAADTGGADGNTRNGHNTPSRGIWDPRQSVDAEESVRIRLEKVSEKDIRRECAGSYAALGIDLPAPDETRPETGSFSHLKVAGGISRHRPASDGGKCRDLLRYITGKRPQPGWTGIRIRSNCSFCRPMPRRAIRTNISITR